MKNQIELNVPVILYRGNQEQYEARMGYEVEIMATPLTVNPETLKEMGIEAIVECTVTSEQSSVMPSLTIQGKAVRRKK